MVRSGGPPSPTHLTTERPVMIKNDNMERYVADRHPHLAPFKYFRRIAA